MAQNLRFSPFLSPLIPWPIGTSSLGEIVPCGELAEDRHLSEGLKVPSLASHGTPHTFRSFCGHAFLPFRIQLLTCLSLSFSCEYLYVMIHSAVFFTLHAIPLGSCSFLIALMNMPMHTNNVPE